MLVAVCVATLVVFPLAGKGWLLLLDWATGPRDGLAAKVFEGRSLPAGPLFFAGAAALRALFGAAGGWLVIAVALGAGAWGCAVLARRGGAIAQVVAGGAYVVNPFVHDRLYVGHVALLAGMAALPWFANALLTAPAKDRRASVGAGVVLAVAIALDVHLLWIAALLVLAAVLVERSRALHAAIALGVAAVLTAPWLVPLAGDTVESGGSQAVAAFGTRSDPDLGLTLGLVAQSGFWREGTSRAWAGPVALRLVALALVLAVTALGCWPRRTLTKGPAAAADPRVPGAGPLLGTLGVAAAVALILAHGDRGPLGPLYRWLVVSVPGFGAMREAQKFVMVITLFQAVALGFGAAALVGATPRGVRRVATPAVFALPLLLAPTTPWGLTGAIAPSRYPPSWAEVDRVVGRDDRNIAVLPWALYYDPGFTDGRVVAAAARSYLGPRALTSRDPEIAGVPFADEHEEVGLALSPPCPDTAATLARHDVGWVVVFTGLIVSPPQPEPCGQFVVELSLPDVRVYRVLDQERRTQ